MSATHDFNMYLDPEKGAGYHLFIDRNGMFYRVGAVSIIDTNGEHQLLHQEWAKQLFEGNSELLEKNRNLLEQYMMKKQQAMVQRDRAYSPYDFLTQECGWVAYFLLPQYLISEKRVQNYYECRPLVGSKDFEYSPEQVHMICKMNVQNQALPSSVFANQIKWNKYATTWYQEHIEQGLDEKKR